MVRLRYFFLFFMAAWGITWFFLDQLPSPETISPELYKEPRQIPTSTETFYVEYKGQRNTIQPVAEYELWGLVVSHNEPAAWYRFDISHDDQSFDTRDFCVIWGDNLKTNDYFDVDFYSGDYTCYYRSKHFLKFNTAQLSNNHLLTNSDTIRELISDVKIGDQIHIKGKLVNYSEERWKGFTRNSSLTRLDRGNGACEVLFVEELNIIASHNALVRFFHELSFWLVLVTLALRCVTFLYGCIKATYWY